MSIFKPVWFAPMDGLRHRMTLPDFLHHMRMCKGASETVIENTLHQTSGGLIIYQPVVGYDLDYQKSFTAKTLKDLA